MSLKKLTDINNNDIQVESAIKDAKGQTIHSTYVTKSELQTACDQISIHIDDNSGDTAIYFTIWGNKATFENMTITELLTYLYTKKQVFTASLLIYEDGQLWCTLNNITVSNDTYTFSLTDIDSGSGHNLLFDSTCLFEITFASDLV